MTNRTMTNKKDVLMTREVHFMFREDWEEYERLKRRMELLILSNSNEYIYGTELDDLEQRYPDVLGRPYVLSPFPDSK